MSYSVSWTQDADGNDVYWAEDEHGDWPGDPHPTRELAQEEVDHLNSLEKENA